MKKILLACNGGFSTSMLVTQMINAARKSGIEAEIEAVAETDVEDYQDWDILLLGPQIGHRQEELAEEMDCPVLVIDSFYYGTMNGERVLEFALEHIDE